LGISSDIEVCREWWGRGGRRWHSAVDEPGDIPVIEAKMAAESVVGLDMALREIMDSGVSVRTKDLSQRIFDAHIKYHIEGVDLGLLNV